MDFTSGFTSQLPVGFDSSEGGAWAQWLVITDGSAGSLVEKMRPRPLLLPPNALALWATMERAQQLASTKGILSVVLFGLEYKRDNIRHHLGDDTIWDVILVPATEDHGNASSFAREWNTSLQGLLTPSDSLADKHKTNALTSTLTLRATWRTKLRLSLHINDGDKDHEQWGENSRIRKNSEGHMSLVANRVVDWLASQPRVHWIERVPLFSTRNAFARARTQTRGVGVSEDLLQEEGLEKNNLMGGLKAAVGLSGVGETMSIGDTGLDYESCYFSDSTRNVTIFDDPHVIHHPMQPLS